MAKDKPTKMRIAAASPALPRDRKTEEAHTRVAKERLEKVRKGGKK